MKKLFLVTVLISTLFSCKETVNTTNTDGLDSSALSAITIETYKNYVTQLSSDEFMGRMPFTKGDTLTVEYIKKQFEDLKLAPGNHDSYFQEVPMVETTSNPTNKQLTFKGKSGEVTINHLDDYVIGSRKLKEKINIDNSELVFVGFGIVAPEFNWNDYEGIDVKGKTVVAMVNDPGMYDKNLFKADTMTYYGRWTYKYEEAARQGATGVLLIHDTKAASYGWNVVRSGWTGPQLNLVGDDLLTEIEGWVTTESANKIFSLAGISSDIQETAKKPGFKAIPLNIQVSTELSNNYRTSQSNNVIAKLEGTSRPDEVIIYTAHWDHLGIGEAVDGDSIYNGAIDNAAGVAALFEIAKAFQAADKKPERTIVFLAVTAEEQGLLGSAYYAENPIFPLNKTVANINMDAFNAIGATRDVSVVGIGQTEIEDYVEKSAAKFSRIMRGEGNPSSGGFYRSDHFNFVKVGVPGLFMGSGSDYIEKGSEALEQRKKAMAGRYHAPSDQVDENWDFTGIIEDIKLFFDIGHTLSLEKTFPNFKEKSEFRELGNKRLAQ